MKDTRVILKPPVGLVETPYTTFLIMFTVD